ncbi:MAG: 2-C-methyl-D-erythritol 2,4-cyclodiphosphate synthase [Kiritimatiellia bacterium]|jgi:2-C-methyl-D-erythritol 2,4-cyclodiphosphate synthase
MIRTGIGWDAHRLVENRRLVLGGVVVPHERGLLGHSDADVATHALMDALLGAIAAGDIGRHFPDTDPAWEGADSIRLLKAVAALLAGRGWRVVNTDMTILCEKPRLAPHIPEMRRRLAEAMGVEAESVSVKATTVEGMGAIGRKEGIAAMAVATVERCRPVPRP